jgi:hypothetical protein
VAPGETGEQDRQAGAGRALLDLEDHGKAKVELVLPGNRHLWYLTRAGHREVATLLPPTAKLSALRPETDGPGTAFSEHALDVVATAGLLTKGGFGTLLSFSTEVAHALPGRGAQFADLVLREPGWGAGAGGGGRPGERDRRGAG